MASRGLGLSGQIVVVPQYGLWGIDATNGDVRWSYGGPSQTAGTRDPVVAGDTVFASSLVGWASAIRAETGNEIWSVDLEEAAFSPAVSNRLVIYGTRGFTGSGSREGPLGSGHVIALDRITGSEVWRFPLPDSSGFPLSGGAVSGGVVWGDRVVVGAVSGRVYALALTDGSLLWEAASEFPPPSGGIRVTPKALGDLIVIGHENDIIVARRADNGVLEWIVETPVGVDPPVVIGTKGIVASGRIAIFDSGGKILWQHGGADTPIATSFFSYNVSEDGMIYSIGRSGLPGQESNYIYAIRPPL